MIQVRIFIFDLVKDCCHDLASPLGQSDIALAVLSHLRRVNTQSVKFVTAMHTLRVSSYPTIQVFHHSTDSRFTPKVT